MTTVSTTPETLSGAGANAELLGALGPRALLSAIRVDAGGDALLAYAALVDPDPLQVNQAGRITLVVSNSGSKAVIVQDILVTLPVGTTGKALTRSTAGIAIDVPDGWDGTLNGGVIKLKPISGSADIGRSGISFVISSFLVNAEPGTCAIPITENSALKGQPAQSRRADLSVPKFPEQFRVSELRVIPETVGSGGAVMLDWSGSATDTTYTLEYQPADDRKSKVSEAVESTGPHRAEHLTHRDFVLFTLVVDAKVPGQDAPLVVRRQAVVAVETLSLELSISPSNVAPNGLARLHWESANAVSCVLDPGGQPIEKAGDRYVVITDAAKRFAVTAVGSNGARLQRHVEAFLDPSIQPTETSIDVVGKTGAAGKHSREAGGRGENVSVEATAGALDETGRPARVVLISVRGGPGGAGGNGTYADDGDPGANGGQGGDARLDLHVDPSIDPPAQYIVIVAGGAGGGGGAYRAAPDIFQTLTAPNGPPGAAFLRIDP